MLQEIYGIFRGSLIFASLHQNFKTFIMGMPENMGSARIVYALGFGRLDAWNMEARTLNAWSLENWTLGLQFWTKN